MQGLVRLAVTMRFYGGKEASRQHSQEQCEAACLCRISHDAEMVLSYKKCIVKEPVIFDELLLCGGERGIRTPVTVFAVNMISNHAPSTARTPLHVCSLTYRSAPY